MTINNKRIDHHHIEELIYQLSLKNNNKIKFIRAEGKGKGMKKIAGILLVWLITLSLIYVVYLKTKILINLIK